MAVEPEPKSKMEILTDRIKDDILKGAPLDKIFQESFVEVFEKLHLHKNDFENQKPYLQILQKIMRVHPELEVFLK